MIQPEIRQLLKDGQPGQPATVRGWVRTSRVSKNLIFMEVNDGSCIQNIQVIVPRSTDLIKNKFSFKAKSNSEDIIISIQKTTNEDGTVEVTQEGGDWKIFDIDLLLKSTGISVSVSGLIKESQGGKQKIELEANDVTILGTADSTTYPLQKKGHSLEFLREIAHLRPRTNTFGAILRLRHAMAFGIHEFFNDRGFFYVQTPVITGSDAEGAGAMFRVTTLDAQNPPVDEQGQVDYSQDFFGNSTNLTVSGQLEGELTALALGKVYTFGPTFRAENSNTTRHLAEFWMIEPEMAFYDLADNADLAEAMLKHLVTKALERCPDDLAFLAERYDGTLLDRLKSVIAEPFKRITYTEAVSILEKADAKFEFSVSWGTDLQSEHERYLVEKHFGRPVILTDYPKEIKAFYMRQNDDGKTVAAMDVLFPGIGEIIGGSQREERLDKLEQRMAEMHVEADGLWWYLDTRRYGTVPHAGFGLGFERLMLFITGMGNIRDVIPFPRYPGNAAF